MWWSDPALRDDADGPDPARRAALLTLAALAGCGFTPVYAPGNSGAALPGAVEVVQPGGDLGYWMTQSLEDRFGPPVNPRYRLTMTLSASTDRVAVTAAQSTTRYNLVGNAGFRLTDIASGTVVVTGNVDGFTSYSAAGSTVANRAALRDAFRRLAVILSDKIMLDLYAAPGLKS